MSAAIAEGLLKKTASSRATAPTPSGPDLLTRIEQLRSKLSKSEKRIVEVLLRDTHGFARMNVKEVAAAADVSEPTVVRFCRNVGCSGFKDLKIQIVQDLAYRQATQEGEAERAREPSLREKHPGPTNAADKVYDAAVAAMQRARATLDRKTIAVAASAIAGARRVVIYGVGGSSAVMANEAHNRLFRLNISSVAHIDGYMQRMAAATLDKRDVALFLSSTGRPRSLLDTLELAKYYGAKCIGITPRHSAIGRELDICVDLELTQGGVHQFHPNPMRYAQLYAIDCVAYAVALELGTAAETALKRTRASVSSLHGIAPLQPIGD